MIDQDIIMENTNYINSPVGLMSIYGQPNMIKERNQVNGLFGLSMIKEDSYNYRFSSLNILLKNVTKKTLLLDFKNKKMITGQSPPTTYTFKGKIDSNSDTVMMNVWVQYSGTPYKILVDTGTLYSQFKTTGEINLTGIENKGSKGTIILKNSRILPYELVGDKPVILGFNDLRNGSLFIDFDNFILYINQN